MSNLVERVAEAIFCADNDIRPAYMDLAKAAIAEMFNALAKPSEEMEEAGQDICNAAFPEMEDLPDARLVWKAMLEQARRESLGE